MHPYLVLGPAGNRAVVHVVLRRVIQPGPVPVARDQAERLDLRESIGGHAHQLPRIVEGPVESRGRRFRLHPADQRDRLVLQGADHLGGRAVLANRRVCKRDRVQTRTGNCSVMHSGFNLGGEPS